MSKATDTHREEVKARLDPRREELLSSESEALYREIFEHAPISIWVEDWSAAKAMMDRLARRGVKDWRRYFRRRPEQLINAANAVFAVDVSQATLDVYRATSKEDVTDTTSGENMSPDELATFREQLIAFAEGATSFDVNATERALDGSEIMTQVHAVISPRHRDDWSRVLYTIADITERKRAEEALRESERHLELIMNAVPAGISYFGTDERFRLANQKYQSLLGMPPSDLIGKTLKEAIGEKPYKVAGLYAKRALKGEPIRFENTLPAEDGGEISIAVSYVPHFGSNGTVQGFVALVNDITERKRAEEALRESEETHRSIIETTSEGYIETSAEARLIKVNNSFCAMLGYQRQELLGQSFFSLLDEESPQILKAQLRKRRRQILRTYDLNVMTKDGRKLTTTIHATTLYDQGGEITGGFAFVSDITERKKAEEALRKAHDELEFRVEERTAELREANEALQRAQFALDHASDAALWLDRDGHVVYANGATCRMLGYSRDELLSSSVTDYDPDASLDDFDRAFERIKARGPSTFEARHRSKVGNDIPVEVSIHYMQFGDKEFMCSYSRDITERKRAQAQLIQASKLATLGEMATAMAHELNQPLNVIRMAADSTIERVEEGAADAQYLGVKLGRISAQTERAALIIDHMQIFGRKAHEKPEALDPRQVVNDTLGLVGQQLRLRSIEVEVVLPERCRKVLGHAVQLEQVLLNLIANARDSIEATKRKPGDPRKISLIVEDKGRENTITLIVKDTGGGIPEATMSRIFEPFFTTKNVSQGTGLGLSVSYGIISDMGGTIDAANAQDGAVFTITLPAIADRRSAH